MDANRLIALAVFLFSGYMLLEAWDKDQHPHPHQVTAESPQGAGTPPVLNVPLAGTPGNPSGAGTTNPGVGAVVSGAALQMGNRVSVTTDVFHAEIDANGGDLRRLTLLKHLAADNGSDAMVLMQDTGVPLYVVQSGLIGAGLPNHTTVFVPSAHDVKLEPGKDIAELTLSAPLMNGVEARKTYIFHRGTYLIDIRWSIHNTSSVPFAGHAYFQFLRDATTPPGDPRFVSTFTGSSFYTDASLFQKVAFGDIDKEKAKVPPRSNDGWVAMMQHYFVSALIPASGDSREFFARKVTENLYTAGVIVDLGEIAPGATKTLNVPLYSGPQEGEKLKDLAKGLDLTIDYGWLAIIAVPIWHVLAYINSWVGNWGWSIVLLTVGIKLVFFPLSAASYRSMAKMRVVAPKLQRIKELYENDTQKRNQAMMELYKTEKINPLGGCLPVLIQIPVFIALYWTLLAAVELRHAPFLGWIHDLSAQDPLYILPIIMGISSFIQTKMQPPPPDPVQAKVMMIMPLAFSVMFFFFPAGLVLYWVVNNTLSILQQWTITRKIEKAAAH
jgi:YidC/Oxa1 family membrane protein insertase